MAKHSVIYASAAFLAVLLLVAACSSTAQAPSPTASAASAAPATPGPCPAAVLDGVLIAGPDGIALRDPSGAVWRLVWPADVVIGGTDPATIVDASGVVIAKVGDTVSVGGGETNEANAWNACGGITVVSPG